MSTSVLILEGTIVNRLEVGESHLRIFIFSAEEGMKVVLHRISKKSNSIQAPDLFDDVEFVTNNSNGMIGIPFVKDFQIIKKRHDIAHGHSRFQVASTLARLYLDNGFHLQDTIPFGRLLINSLNALNEGLDPPCILLKTLFKFGQLEGLPVKEDWLLNLDEAAKLGAIFRLNTKLSDQVPQKDFVMSLVNSLCNWLNSETELIC